METVQAGRRKEGGANQTFRSELVGVRRRMLSLSQSELADSAGMAQGTVSKIEQGLKEPTEEQVRKLAEALNCPVSFFFQAGREYGPPMSAHPMFRKKTSVGQKVLDQLIAELNVRIGHTRTFISAVDFEPELPFPHYDPDDFGGDMEAVADAVRKAWYVPRGPMKSLTDYAERAGCIVVQCEMEASRVDGVSYNVPGVPPLIFLNRNQPADRMRFSLAHELGHLVLHRYPNVDMERQANEFASALLMPSADIAADLADMTLNKAAAMKLIWRVSMASLIVRATTLGKLDRNQAAYLWRTMSARGFRTREPAAYDFEIEQTSLMPALVQNLVEDMDYSMDELGQVLHLYEDELSELYGFQRPSGLRVVK